ncbi:unnamed protein product [Dracunculus medinensis]|uniref:VWFA domain-containing protein n=1 Tax=Dracunculus medinensis TaxID=318479 RepID=A0A0N4U2W0_DRAME|nr:unnamed protein product [Dracunculus medinensis]
MQVVRVILFIVYVPLFCELQYTSQIYPDPRFDAFSCKIVVPGPLCDPDDIINFGDKNALIDRINELVSSTTSIENSSPACKNQPNKNLQIIVAVVDKIGQISNLPVDLEKFANNLKSRYQNFQDPSYCDQLVLIVNSRSDRQVYTVAGKDTKLSKAILKAAFENSIANFRVNFAVAQCGNNQERLSGYVRAVVENAMSISLRLLTDKRYTKIEEYINDKMLEDDGEAWTQAKNNFIDDIYRKYSLTIRTKAIYRCPIKNYFFNKKRE